MPKRVKELSNIEIDEISLVDKPANQHAKVAIAKRAPEEELMPEIYDEYGNFVDLSSLEEGDIVVDEEGNEYVWTLEADDEDDVDAFDGEDLYSIEDELVEVGKAFTEDFREELSKALTDIDRDEVISKYVGEISKAEARALAAEEIAKSERTLRLEREYISKAAEYNVPIAPEELGPVLMRMAETMSYEDCSTIHKALTSAGEILWEEVGYQGMADNDDVFSQVDALAGEFVSKSAGDISKHSAVADLFASNPRAYDEYISQRRGF